MVALAFGAIHGITLGFGLTLIGEAVDYAIYVQVRGRATITTELWREDKNAVLWREDRNAVCGAACGSRFDVERRVVAMMLSGSQGWCSSA